MQYSLLIVAALYQLVTKGEKFLSDSKLPVCDKESREGFSSIQSGSVSGSMSVKFNDTERLLRTVMATFKPNYADMKFEQANNILGQLNTLKESKFWEEHKNVSVISSSYSPESKEFSFYALSMNYLNNGKKESYRKSEYESTVQFAGFKRFQSTSYYAGEEISEDTYLDGQTNEDPDEIISALQISLLPFVFTKNDEFMDKIIMPIVDVSIKQIEKGELPYGVTEANKEDVKQKLLSIVKDGFPMSLNSSSVTSSLNEKCK